MNVLSLFDGIACGKVALDRLGIKYDKYFASEIEGGAVHIAKANHPDIIHIGDVKKVKGSDLPKIDLLMGGSPCQDLSQAMKNRKGLGGTKSSLFFEFVRLFDETKPEYFLFENVGGAKKEDIKLISEKLGVEPIRINSSLVSGALRNRLYWTNIPNVKQPEDKNIKLQDILESGYADRLKARALLSSDSRPLRDKKRMLHRYYNTGFTTIVFDDKGMTPENCRYLTQTELERCMNLPVGYTSMVKRDKAAFHIGNGWTVDVIAHILKGMNDYVPKIDCSHVQNKGNMA
ncbi:MAG: hypothetical protein EOL95_12335 [Bacteroidia bacterium]|nr:hypothetical protein [Bacteroidia bacterium]